MASSQEEEVDLATLEREARVPRSSIWKWVRKGLLPRGRRVYGHGGKRGSSMVWPAAVIDTARKLAASRDPDDRQEVVAVSKLRDGPVKNVILDAMDVVPNAAVSYGEFYPRMLTRGGKQGADHVHEVVVGTIAVLRQLDRQMPFLVEIAQALLAKKSGVSTAEVAAEHWLRGEPAFILVTHDGLASFESSIGDRSAPAIVIPVGGVLGPTPERRRGAR